MPDTIKLPETFDKFTKVELWEMYQRKAKFTEHAQQYADGLEAQVEHLTDQRAELVSAIKVALETPGMIRGRDLLASLIAKIETEGAHHERRSAHCD